MDGCEISALKSIFSFSEYLSDQNTKDFFAQTTTFTTLKAEKRHPEKALKSFTNSFKCEV